MATKPKPKTSARNVIDFVYSNYSPYPSATEWAYQNPAPVSQPFDKGYDVTAPRLHGLRRAGALSAANAVLVDGSDSGAYQMSIFVAATMIDVGLAGSTGQSQLSRDWYPRNFIQPKFKVVGWSLDQQDYGLLCEFVHQAQRKSVTNMIPTQLQVYGRHENRGIDGTRQGAHVPKVTLSQPGTLMPKRPSDPASARRGEFHNQTIRGSHQGILCQGYVTTMPRKHQAGQTAVQWSFDFTVTVMMDGIYSEPQAISVAAGKTWADILADVKKRGIVAVSAKENTEALAAAQKNAYALFQPGQFANQSGAGGQSGVNAGGQTNPAPGATWGRLDMGFDGDYGSAGAVAPFNGTINGIGIGGWPGQGQYFAVLNDDQSGPDYTRAMYFAEGATPIYPNGTHVKAGQRIGNPVLRGGTGAPGNFEIGPAQTGNFDTLAKAYGLKSPGARAMVMSFYNWMRSLGAGATTDPTAAGGP